jgi:hypothetical protein
VHWLRKICQQDKLQILPSMPAGLVRVVSQLQWWWLTYTDLLGLLSGQETGKKKGNMYLLDVSAICNLHKFSTV